MEMLSSEIKESITDEKISYEDFLAHYEDTFAEWVDGRIIMSPPVSFKHLLFRKILAKYCLHLIR